MPLDVILLLELSVGGSVVDVVLYLQLNHRVVFDLIGGNGLLLGLNVYVEISGRIVLMVEMLSLLNALSSETSEILDRQLGVENLNRSGLVTTYFGLYLDDSLLINNDLCDSVEACVEVVGLFVEV